MSEKSRAGGRAEQGHTYEREAGCVGVRARLKTHFGADSGDRGMCRAFTHLRLVHHPQHSLHTHVTRCQV